VQYAFADLGHGVTWDTGQMLAYDRGSCHFFVMRKGVSGHLDAMRVHRPVALGAHVEAALGGTLARAQMYSCFIGQAARLALPICCTARRRLQKVVCGPTGAPLRRMVVM
jgi:hypothetical protein